MDFDACRESLIAYVVLGPLHYLTEMAWLDRRGYFLPRRNDFRWLVAFAVCGTLISILMPIILRTKEIDSEASAWFRYHLQQIGVTIGLMAFATSLVFSLTVRTWLRGVAIVAISSGGISFYYYGDAYFYYFVFAVLLPTLVHVYVFTAAFMLFGALKSRNLFGLTPFLLLLAGGLLLLFVDMGRGVTESSYFLSAYRSTLGFLNENLATVFFRDSVTMSDPVLSPSGMRMTRFLAFSYTYHYLNWFSKTTVTQWHKLSGKQMVAISSVWASSIAIYCLDFRTGLVVVGFLSLLHVFLEFPLNWLSMRGIAKELSSIATKGWEMPADGMGNLSQQIGNTQPSS